MKKSLTKRQEEIYNFIKDKIVIDKIPPTIKEICENFKIRSTNAVSEVLRVLDKKGYIKFLGKGKSRGISLTEIESIQTENKFSDDIRIVNIAGKGNSSNASSVFLNSSENIKLDANYFHLDKKDYFAAIVTDNGLGKEGIISGDLVIVAQGRSLESGQIVVALVEEKLIVRYLERYYDKDELIPKGRGYSKIVLNKRDKSKGVILGVVKTIIKQID